jgi:RNA polymerase sigma-70 factor (ECF subfamily)
VRQREEQAARDLMGQLYPLVLKIVRAHLPRRSTEEDLCQMTFIKIFNNIDQYSGKVPFEHWASRIAVNTCLNQLKAEKVRPELRLADLSETECRVIENLSASKEELEDSNAAKDLVHHLLEQLAPQDRLVIRLLHLEERSIEEIKALTGWSTPLVKVRAFRARQKLKSLYNRLAKSRLNAEPLPSSLGSAGLIL